jgi:spore maturation protein CgeB
MKILYITRYQKNHAIVFGNDMADELIKHGHLLFDLNQKEYASQQAMQENVEAIVNREKIDWVLWSVGVGSYEFDPLFLRALRTQTIIALLSAGDCEHIFEPLAQYYAQCVDFVLSFSMAAVHKYREIGVPSFYFTNYFDTQKYTKLDLEKEYDVSFIGAVNKPKRAEYIAYLREHGINVSVFGSGSNNGMVSHEEMIRIFNRSKINLNFTMVDEYTILTKGMNGFQRRRQPKGRPIECLMCGSFVLSEYAYGMEAIFEPHVLEMFDSKEMLLRLCRYYLEHEEEREQKAQILYDYSQKKFGLHRFVSDLEAVFEAYKSLRYRNSDALKLDRVFKRNYATFHLLQSIVQLPQNSKAALSEFGIFLKFPWINTFYFRAIAYQKLSTAMIALLTPAMKAKLRKLIRSKRV